MIRFMNNVKTALLLGGLMGLFLLVGGAMGGKGGLLIALVLGGLTNVVAFLFSDKIAIAAMQGREVDERTGGDLYAMVKELAPRAGVPMPRVYICPQEAPNAFATGPWPSRGAVAVTQGALRLLDHEEMRGVMAHELAHIRNRDTLTSTIAATVAGILAYLAQMSLWIGMPRDSEGRGSPLALVAVILAPLAAMLIQMAISRSREYVADADAAEIAGTPHGLISALTKLDGYSRRIPMRNPNPAQNNLFIVEPLCGSSLAGMFATHPPTEKRIAALRKLA